MTNYTEIFGSIMRKKVMIMRKRCKIMRKFRSLQVNAVPRILVLYDMFDHLLPFVDRYPFVQLTLSIVFIVEFVRSLVTRH